MTPYKIRAPKIIGNDYKEINKQAFAIYKRECARTKRKPYIRSKYFNKDKIFLELFWQHLWQKNWRDRKRRLVYFSCALDLMRNTHQDPISVQNPNNKTEILHRFTGITKCRESFLVQIKENKKNNQKWFMSVFPI